jgi:hypothetical protein
VSVEIHAAIIGGALAGLVVVLGVVLTEWLTRIRTRGHEVGQAAHDLVINLPIALLYMSSAPPDDDKPGFGSKAWEANQRVTDAMFRIDRLTRRRPMRHRQAIRRELDDLSARFTALEVRNYQGQMYTARDLQLRVNAGRLFQAAVGDREGPLDEAIERYIESGIPELSD